MPVMASLGDFPAISAISLVPSMLQACVARGFGLLAPIADAGFRSLLNVLPYANEHLALVARKRLRGIARALAGFTVPASDTVASGARCPNRAPS